MSVRKPSDEKITNWPVYWFLLLEQYLQAGDLDGAAFARRELKRLKVHVRYDDVPETYSVCPESNHLANHHTPIPIRGFTVKDVATRLRIGPDKVRGMIRRGELKAVNTSTTKAGKPRWVITPESLAEFENGRLSSAPPKPRRKRKAPNVVDYYP